jgi:pilus assembly protein CpaE
MPPTTALPKAHRRHAETRHRRPRETGPPSGSAALRRLPREPDAPPSGSAALRRLRREPDAPPSGVASRRLRGEAGQATVELVALLPCITALLCAVWQLALVGHAVWAASAAARAAARAVAVGADPGAAARAHLPRALEPGLRVRSQPGDAVEVRIRIQALPGLPSPGHTSATSRFGAAS